MTEEIIQPSSDAYEAAKESTKVRVIGAAATPKTPVLVPKAQYRYMILKVIANQSGLGEGFAPPADFGKSEGGIYIPHNEAASAPAWASNIYEIVGIGDAAIDSKDATGQMPGHNLRVGQWVCTNSVSIFTFCGTSYATCSPEYITAIVKEPDQDPSEFYNAWNEERRAKIEDKRKREEAAKAEYETERENLRKEAGLV